MAEAVLDISHLSKSFGALKATDDVSLDLRPGEIHALIGPNGAGKTTLMRCLAALDEPLRGSIRMEGRDALADPPATHRRLGYLPDLFGLYEQLSVRQCLTYRAWAQGVAKHEVAEAVAWAAAQLGLADRLGEAAGSLSRGLKQRLAVAQAIIHRPPLLILDEPASGLDPEARIDLARVLRGLRAAGITLMVSSHILSELEDYSTHLMIIDGGRLLSFEPLAAGGPEAPTVDVEVRFLPGRSGLEAALAAAGHAASVVDETAVLTLPGDPEALAAALAALVRAGLPVVSFAPRRTSLQCAYLELLKGARP